MFGVCACSEIVHIFLHDMRNMRNMRIFGCPLRRRYLRANPGVSETYEKAFYLAHNPEMA